MKEPIPDDDAHPAAVIIYILGAFLLGIAVTAVVAKWIGVFP